MVLFRYYIYSDGVNLNIHIYIVETNTLLFSNNLCFSVKGRYSRGMGFLRGQIYKKWGSEKFLGEVTKNGNSVLS